MNDIHGALRKLLEELYNGEEHIAGSSSEYREADRIGGILESHLGGNVEVLDVPMISWSLKAVEVEPRPGYVVVAPYVESSDVEARVYHVERDPSDYKAWRTFPQGKIAVTIPPGNPDDLKYVALQAWEAGAEAVIVGSDRPRKIVSTGSWGYSYTAGAPTPIPVVVVDVASARRIAWEGKARIYVESVVREARGANIRLRLPGNEAVAVGAHYDRWYGGFQDDILGIAQAAVTAELLNRKGYMVDLLVFTAEEHGAPGYAGWYWAWGSRWYARQLQASGLAGEYAAYINYDVAGNRPLAVSGAPQYTHRVLEGLEKAGVSAFERRFECPECDSMSLAQAGIPTVSIHSLWNERVREVYHTPYDTPENADLGAAAAAVKAVVESVVEGPVYSRLEASLEAILGEGPLIARNIHHTLVAMARVHGWDRVYRWMASRFLKPVLIGDYRYDYGQDFEAVYFPEVYSIKRMREAMPHSVIIPGEERLLYQLKPPGRLEDQVLYTLLDLWGRFREELEWLER